MASVQMARRWIDRRLDHSTAEVYKELCEKLLPLHIVDKSPSYSKQTENLQRIRATFPNARYLYLTRHPRGQCSSMLKAPQAVLELTLADSIDYSISSPIIDPQIEWYRTQCRIIEFLNDIPSPQKMILRGEDLIQNPRSHLQKICEWLNLSWNESSYQSMLHPENSSYACMGPLKTQWGNNPGFQRSPAFRQKSLPTLSLEGLLPWRPDRKGFTPEVFYLAQELGYR